MTTSRINQYGLQVAKPLYDFIEQEALPGTELDSASFWKGFSALAHDLAPRNRELLAQRDRFQQQLDDWHRAHPGPIADHSTPRRMCAGR